MFGVFRFMTITTFGGLYILLIYLKSLSVLLNSVAFNSTSMVIVPILFTLHFELYVCLLVLCLSASFYF